MSGFLERPVTRAPATKRDWRWAVKTFFSNFLVYGAVLAAGAAVIVQGHVNRTLEDAVAVLQKQTILLTEQLNELNNKEAPKDYIWDYSETGRGLREI